MKIWIIILSMAFVTYLLRLLPLTVINSENLPVWLKRSLPYVPVAVLSALVGVQFLPSESWLHYTVDARLVAGLIAVGVAWLSKNVSFTIISGMSVLLLFG